MIEFSLKVDNDGKIRLKNFDISCDQLQKVGDVLGGFTFHRSYLARVLVKWRNLVDLFDDSDLKDRCSLSNFKVLKLEIIFMSQKIINFYCKEKNLLAVHDFFMSDFFDYFGKA